ncbi:T9SS type A sorting domain-containing protein [Ferruginibacter sp. SUN002]|uniref:T9SS type A sorting domain-containing protein n=1 Tax=Ferruginibacter sp. SUN002 TaxID=2937789 RepID=UPI003D359D55
MKHLSSTVILMLLLSTAFTQTKTKQDFTKSNLSTGVKNSIDEVWLDKAQNIIKESEYFFKENTNAFTYTVVNKTQHIGFFITPTDYKVFPIKYSHMKKDVPDWQENLSLTEIKKGATHFYPDNTFTLTSNKSNLIFSYTDFDIEYNNSAAGLRQNFIVKNKPAGNDDLEVLLKLDGSLSPSLVNNGLEFKDDAGSVKLYYQDLNVWDADQKPIAASMELRGNNLVAIVVKDQHAKYPLTIDPLNKTPEWTTSADGILPTLIGQLAIDAAYGFSVAGLGDVNGDGFDDVAVGAPASVDIISGTSALANVGAVFIYYGGIGGLSTTPSAVLQPTTPIAGALFGYSIAGGDINGDSKNDIIIGAPMDVVTISAGGSSTASGTIGKVYAYDGATLTTGCNPLLTLSLNGNGILEHNLNLSVKALFGFSVAVTQDLNNDSKKDIIVGAPTYAGIKTVLGISLLDVQSGGAFVFLSNQNDDSHSLIKLNPIKTSLLGLGLLANNINGLLFGYCVDGLGDYNGDGRADVVASAPAGVNLSSLGGILNGKLLQGSASIYYGTGSGVNVNPGATLTATSGGLLTNLVGSVANLANLFGVSVKGIKDANGNRTGGVLVGAPLGGTIINVLGLDLKTGTVNVFKKKTSSPSGFVTPDQTLSSPRNSNTILGFIQANLLFGYALDNAYDVNCDGIGDIIIGEPASSGLQLLNTNVSGGAAYVYLGKANGTYQTTPAWTLTATEDAFLGINTTSLIGFSVAGAGHVKGGSFENRILTGSPSRTLDFGAGLLNLGSTLGTLFSLAIGDNGVGKAYLFNTQMCSGGGPLAVKQTKLKGAYINGTAKLTWTTKQEINSYSFEIERSSNGVTYQLVGKINAAGNSNTDLNYQYNDNIVAGVYYYRVKATDINGTYVYSNVIALNASNKSVSTATIYPTVFTNKINADVLSDANGIAYIRLFDNTGKVIVNQQVIIHKGMNNLTIENLSRLNRGSYVMQIQTTNNIVIKKIIK